jgi:hypothetical protein
MKKGAMFGLDARIALAIFGALSGKVRYNTYSVGIIMYQGLPRVRR